MKVLVVLALATLAHARSIDQQEQPMSAHGFNAKYSIPLGEKIRAYEESLLNSSNNRITGGSSSSLGQFPYQAGVLTNFIGVAGTGVCGGSLVTPNRVIHAAHCWFDGQYQGWQSVVVLGSVTLFTGGTRLTTSNIVMHPQWNTALIRNDVAVIFLSNAVTYTNNIQPIALPSGAQLNENFVGEIAVASAFGRTGDHLGGAISGSQTLSHVSVPVITNAQCQMSFPLNVVASNICVSGAGAQSTCSGDSGGPLALTRNSQTILIGITSFGYRWGCQQNWPAAFARVSSFISFFNQHL